VAAAHDLSHKIEDAIIKARATSQMTVHVEPLNTTDPEQAALPRGQRKVRTNDDSPDEREFIH